jgi:hypothetical protein
LYEDFESSSLIFLCIMFIQPQASIAQGNFDDLLKGSLRDANILAEGYAGPAMRALGAGLNHGWYNTAKPHKTLGFDLTFTGSLMYLPGSDQFYKVDNNTLTDIKLVILRWTNNKPYWFRKRAYYFWTSKITHL